MKLTDKDLDPNRTCASMKKFEDVIGTAKEGFMYFDGQKAKVRNLNELQLNKIVSTSELEFLRTNLYQETEMIKNSIFSNFNMNNRVNTNFRTQVLEIAGHTVFETDDEIRKVKRSMNYMLILDRKGIFYKYNLEKKDIDYRLDISSKVKNLFAIKNFQPYDILDFDIFRGGFLFSTKNNGTFFADVEDNNLEVLFPEREITLVRNIDDDHILLVSKDGVSTIYDFESGLKLETFNILKKSDQRLKDIAIDGREIYFLGEHKYKNTTRELLHLMKEDLARITYNNLTSGIYPGEELYGYIPKFLLQDEGHIYVAGTKEGKKLFLWKYDRLALHKEYKEIILDKIPVTGLNFVKIKDGLFYINYENRLMVLDEAGNIRNNIALDVDNLKDVVFEDNKLFAISSNKLSWYKIPTYIFESEFTVKVYEGDPVNDLDIFIKGNTGNELIILLDPESLEQIQPSYYVVYKGNSYMKVLGKTITSLIAKITISEGTEIEGIVVKSDKIFTK